MRFCRPHVGKNVRRALIESGAYVALAILSITIIFSIIIYTLRKPLDCPPIYNVQT